MQRRDHQPPGFSLVFWREIAWLRRRPLLLVLTAVLPLALMLLLTAILSAGLTTRLPIAVLDLDGSELSRAVIRAVDATPDDAAVLHVAELSEGRHLIVARKIRGLLLLPRNLERDVFAGRRPEVVFFYNTQTFTVGNLVLRGANAAIPSVAAGIRISLRTAEGQPVEEAQAAITPIPVQTHALFNSTLNYVHFLLTALLPAVLQTVIVTTMAYAVGLDVETPHRFAVLRRLGGGLVPALFGKMLPYTILFLAILGIADLVLFKYLELPLRGDPVALVIAAILFVLSCQFIGGLLALLLRPVAVAVSIATVLMAPAFGFMGIGFPRLGMNEFAYGYGEILPGTWYLMARVDQTIRGTPIDLSWKPILVLLGFVVVLTSLTAARILQMRRPADGGAP